jgi:hypothetical protein
MGEVSLMETGSHIKTVGIKVRSDVSSIKPSKGLGTTYTTLHRQHLTLFIGGFNLTE